MKVIHCSERDTQITDRPKLVDEFVNTWSVEGFREEETTTAELGWGTHEKELPPFAFEHSEGPRSQICLARMGMNTFVNSWVPNYNIVGMVVRHGEAFSITEKLTVWENGQAVYRPTVHYAYCPCDSAIASLHELRGYDYRLQSRIRIMTDEITDGADILGALVMGHPYQSWWCGSNLGIEESRRLVPHRRRLSDESQPVASAGQDPRHPWLRGGSQGAAGKLCAVPQVPAAGAGVLRGQGVRGGKLCYYLDDGVYHTYSGVIFDHCQYHLKSFTDGPKQISSVFGPTCDALDTISLAEQLPDMDLGDFIYAENIGAYSAASSTHFNGFPPARTIHINQRGVGILRPRAVRRAKASQNGAAATLR